MTNPGESQLVLYLILYVILPIWTVAGAVDWWCHRRTKIEKTAAAREPRSTIMGVQVGLPILACLMFEVNVLLMLFCFFILITHEYVAHQDIVYATPRRHISHLETHVHSYLSTVPFYLVSLIVVRRFDSFIKMITLDWSGEMSLVWRQGPSVAPPTIPLLPDLRLLYWGHPLHRREYSLLELSAKEPSQRMNTAYITQTGRTPGEPVDNERIEAVLGYVHDKPSKLKRRILKSNGILAS